MHITFIMGISALGLLHPQVLGPLRLIIGY